MRDQQYFRERAVGEMDAALPQSHLSRTAALAMTCRILAAEGHESGLAGQITARDGDRHFRTLRFGYGFDEASEELMVQVDDDLKPSQPGAMAKACSGHSGQHREAVAIGFAPVGDVIIDAIRLGQ